MKNVDISKILFSVFLILGLACLGVSIYFCASHIKETGFVVGAIILLIFSGIFLSLAGIVRPRRNK